LNKLLLKKKVRYYAARLGILRPVRAVVFKMRGGSNLKSNLTFHSRFISENSHVFDVGANRGQSSEIYTRLGARVTAFEPQVDLHAEIRQLCGRKARITIESCGLGGKEETRTLHITSYDQTASLRNDWEGDRIGKCPIQISTLDRQIKIHGLPDYCKIDVEGWELEVLSGLNQAINIISFEYHTADKELDRAEAVILHISELGSYYCNFKTATDKNFHHEKFIPIREFNKKFRDLISAPGMAGYGEIFCVTDPNIFTK